MKILRTLLVLGVAGLSLQACGGSSDYSGRADSPTPPPPTPPLSYSTSDVLTLARSTSETADPIAVNGGAVSVVPANDETSDAVIVTP